MATLQEKRDEAKALGLNVTNKDTIALLDEKIQLHKSKIALKAGIVSDEQIKAWKAKFGGVKEITVELPNGDTAVGYLKKPKRDHKAIAVTMFNQDKILECGEFLLQNCWLGGDERLKDDENISDSAAIQANTIVNFLKGSSRDL